MAGTPRRMSGGSLSGLHYGLITFVIVSVASLAFGIYELTLVEDLRQRADRADATLSRYGEPPPYYRNEAESRDSKVFNVMDSDRKKLVTLVTGRLEDVASAVERDTDLLIQQLRADHPNAVNDGDALLTTLRKLGRELKASNRDLRNRSDEVAKLQQENQTLNSSIKAVKDDFAAQVEALDQRLAQVAADFDDFKSDKDAQLVTISAAAAEQTEQANQQIQEWKAQLKEGELEIATLNNRIETLRSQVDALKPSAFDPADILTKADGRIRRAIPGSSVVYINLGEDDGLKLGMGFEVFSPTRERSDSLRGKASLEVMALTPLTAECRVTRAVPGRPIIEGDIIVNISYERGRKPRFVIAGAFDMNYDGIEDFDGTERITSMIQEWGGQVADELDTNIDFVIVGSPPRIQIASDADSDVVADQRRTLEAQLTEFRDLISEAQATSIPVINQNQFLFLTGYAGG